MNTTTTIAETARMVQNVRHGRFERSLSALTAIGALVTAGEIFFEHDKASFGNRWMWVPVILGPIGAVAGVAGFFSRGAAKTLLPIASAAIVANGLQGTYLHMRGVAQKPGGMAQHPVQHRDGSPRARAAAGHRRRWHGAARRPAEAGAVSERFPGFDVMSQRTHWDAATAETIERRIAPRGEPRFFAGAELPAARALLGELVGVDDDLALQLCGIVDERLALGRTDGWHYDTMPEDAEAWHRGLAALDDEARELYGAVFAELGREERHNVLGRIHDSEEDQWRGLPASRLWDLWLRYACTAYYALPDAWNEIGFPGPAYPRGYKNLGIDRREPFEVGDAG